jgi:hypothetical protein
MLKDLSKIVIEYEEKTIIEKLLKYIAYPLPPSSLLRSPFLFIITGILSSSDIHYIESGNRKWYQYRSPWNTENSKIPKPNETFERILKCYGSERCKSNYESDEGLNGDLDEDLEIRKDSKEIIKFLKTVNDSNFDHGS